MRDDIAENNNNSGMEARTTDHNSLSEIEDLRVERLPEKLFKQIQSKTLLKIIILGDTGKSSIISP